MANPNEVATATSPKAVAAPAAPAGPNPLVLVRRTLEHWPLLAVVMIVGGLGTAQVVRMRKPAFRSETVIFYREGVQRSLISNDPGGPDPLRTLGAKLKEMLLAQTNLKRVIKEFHLYQQIVDKQDDNAAVEQFRKKIDFKARSTDTFAITFEGTSREEAQVVTARLADLLVDENAKLRQEQARTTTSFLDAEKARSDEELNKYESAIAQFVADHPEFASDNAAGAHVGIGVRAQEQAAHDKVRDAQEKVRAQVKRRALASSPAAAAAAAASMDPALAAEHAQAQAELTAAQRDLVDKQAKYTDEHPDVRAAKARAQAADLAIRTLDARIAAEAPAPAAPAPTPVEVRERAPKVDPSSKASADAPAPKKEDAVVEVETEWARLNREVAKARQRSADLENRLFKAEMTASSEVGGYAAQIVVLDPAFRPTGPSSIPNKTILVAGFVASLVAGLALAALRGLFFDDRIFDGSEVDALAVGPVLAIVPRTHKKRARA